MPQPRTKRRKNKKRTTIRKKRGGAVINVTRTTGNTGKHIDNRLDVGNSNPNDALMSTELVTNVKTNNSLFPRLEQVNYMVKSFSGIPDTKIKRTKARIVVNEEAESQQRQLFDAIDIKKIQQFIAEQSISKGDSSTGGPNSNFNSKINNLFNLLKNIIKSSTKTNTSSTQNPEESINTQIDALQTKIVGQYEYTETSSTDPNSTDPNSTDSNSTDSNFDAQIGVLYDIKKGKLPTDYAQFTEYSKTIPKQDKTTPMPAAAAAPPPSLMELLPDIYKNIPDTLVETIMDPLVSNGGFEEIYVKGEPTTYDNVRWVIVLNAVSNVEAEEKQKAEEGEGGEE